MSLPNSSTLVSEQVFGTLLESLLAGRYQPGEKLPRQRELAADLGVTLSSLREALKRLEQMGLVDVRHGDATRVNDWREHGGLDVLTHLLFRGGGVDIGVLADILEARSLMLRELAGLAAARCDAEQGAHLRELAAAFAEAPDAIAAAHIDFAFFTAVADIAQNLVFVLILNAIRSLYFEHLSAVPVTAAPHQIAPLYAEIADAITSQDTERARDGAFALAGLQADRVA